MKADLKALLAKITNTPIIVEQGTSGNWTYRKWSNGTAECWESKSLGSVAITSPEGYGYYAGVPASYFPTGLFTGGPTITFGVHGGGGLVSFCPNTVASTYYSGYLWCSASSTRSVTIYTHAIGKWK